MSASHRNSEPAPSTRSARRHPRLEPSAQVIPHRRIPIDFRILACGMLLVLLGAVLFERGIPWLGGAMIAFGALAAFAVVLWGWTLLARKLRGDRYQQRARAHAQRGDWQRAAVAYKQAILARLDARRKLDQLLEELDVLYRRQGLAADLAELRSCPAAIAALGGRAREHGENAELAAAVYGGAQELLDELPGPAIPDDG